MSNFTIGNYLAKRLEHIGLKHYFVVPGDYNLVLLDQLLWNKNVEQINCCNELNASYAAEGYARVNGCGVLITTFNVGTFSALNGVVGAYAERLPVIIVSSSNNTSLYVPDLGLIVSGDVAYNHCHMYVGATTADIRAEWIAALDRLAALKPAAVVTGHKDPTQGNPPRFWLSPAATWNITDSSARQSCPIGNCSMPWCAAILTGLAARSS